MTTPGRLQSCKLRPMPRFYKGNALMLSPLFPSQAIATRSHMSSGSAAQPAFTASASSISSPQPALTLVAPSAGASSSGGDARPQPAVNIVHLMRVLLGPSRLPQDKASVPVWKLIKLQSCSQNMRSHALEAPANKVGFANMWVQLCFAIRCQF